MGLKSDCERETKSEREKKVCCYHQTNFITWKNRGIETNKQLFKEESLHQKIHKHTNTHRHIYFILTEMFCRVICYLSIYLFTFISSLDFRIFYFYVYLFSFVLNKIHSSLIGAPLTSWQCILNSTPLILLYSFCTAFCNA